MKNRTYRYFEGEALYPFGYGLSYSKFAYSGAAYQNGERHRDGEKHRRRSTPTRWCRCT